MIFDGINFRLPPIGDAAALRAVARWLRHHAAEAEARADQLDRDRARDRKAHAELETVTAARAALPLASLTPGERQERRSSQRQQRDREILRAAARGWTNAKIAKRWAMHPSTVSRIVARAMRRQDPAATPAPYQSGAANQS